MSAKDGMVLLRNRAHALPLTPGAICLFGNGAVRTVRGGTGSGWTAICDRLHRKNGIPG